MSLTTLVIDLGVSQIPHIVFTIIHLAILSVAVILTIQNAKRGGPDGMRWAFILIALGEISYIGYHLEITTFLLSHTISEVLVLGAIVLFFRSWQEGRSTR